ncbi:uncharacterized protein LOC121373733 [Gigantopelta aegis]|uniref:uncharacterized protein LOC121373733 n=1 Tax=Gigantopelta aegis TaxID=1735272 RepID=UPI001B88E3ED|nr:uncharacterized protein LOC121373733 [Gigantopelta aegis]
MNIVIILAVLCASSWGKDSYNRAFLNSAQCGKYMDAGCKQVDAKMRKANTTLLYSHILDTNMCSTLIPYAMCVTNGCLQTDNEMKIRMQSIVDQCNKLSKRYLCPEDYGCSAAAFEIVVTLQQRKHNSLKVLQELGLCGAIIKIYRCVHVGCFPKLFQNSTEHFAKVMEVCDKRHDLKVLPASDATSVSAFVVLVLLGAMAFLFQ